MVREADNKDYEKLTNLYTELHDNNIPERTSHVEDVWQRILSDKDHHIIVNDLNGEIASSCICVIVPNLTHNQRPYALIENVITAKNYRKMGYAMQCLNYAKDIAQRENCYKMMLLTGAKESGTLSFYEKAGYNRKDKTAFIQWL